METSTEARLAALEAKLDQILALLTPKPRATPPRPRTPAQQSGDRLLLALARIESGNEDLDPARVTHQEFARHAASLSQIRTMTPDVTEPELLRRARNYRIHLPGCPTTSNALAKHWHRCATVTAQDVALYNRRSGRSIQSPMTEEQFRLL